MKFILSIFLLFCLLDMPYGYYQLVRIIASVAFAYFAYKEKNDRNKFIFIFLVILFQPIVKISLGRMLWNVVDVITAIWLLLFYEEDFKDS